MPISFPVHVVWNPGETLEWRAIHEFHIISYIKPSSTNYGLIKHQALEISFLNLNINNTYLNT